MDIAAAALASVKRLPQVGYLVIATAGVAVGMIGLFHFLTLTITGFDPAKLREIVSSRVGTLEKGDLARAKLKEM